MTMREKIARAMLTAIAEGLDGYPLSRPLVLPSAEKWVPGGEDVLVDGEFNPLLVADAVLDALREPTEAMIEAGVKDHPHEQSFDGAETTWQAMIDAAKAEREG